MKKILALLLAVLMLASVLVACGGGGDNNNTNTNTDNGGDPFYGEDNISLLVWAPDKAVPLTKQLCESFIAQYPDKTIAIDVQAQSESDAANQVLNDADKAADVFGFACDQLVKLNKSKVIAPVLDDFLDDVKSRNTEFSVSTGTLNDTLMAYPETGENGYYLVYDKRIVSDEQAKTLEGVLAACKEANRQFLIDCGTGFYSCMFPFTGGLTLEGLTEDGLQKFNDYDEEAVLDSLEAFSNLFHEYKNDDVNVFISAGVDKISSGMEENNKTVAAGIDGSWETAAIIAAIGEENVGAAKLPTINIKGEDKQIISMNGSKLIGVNARSQFPEAAQLLANYLTNEEAQMARVNELGWLPSNKNASESDAVKNNAILSALLEQSQYSVPQVNIAEIFWQPMGTLGNKLYKDEDHSREKLKEEFEKAMSNILEG